MALRGLQRQPDSVRGLVANRGGTPEPIQDEIVTPKMDAEHRRIFIRLVAENRAAGVAIRQIDADIYVDLADCMIRAVEADEQLFLRLAKHISELRSALNMGPRNRQRAGVRDTRKPTALSPTLEFIKKAKAG